MLSVDREILLASSCLCTKIALCVKKQVSHDFLCVTTYLSECVKNAVCVAFFPFQFLAKFGAAKEKEDSF